MNDQGNRPDAPASSAKRLDRRDTLKLLGAALTGAVASSVRLDAGSPVGATAVNVSPVSLDSRGPAWRMRPLAGGTVPRSFTVAEFATITAAVDRIIPDTDTPGARTAGVHWYLDDICQVETRLRDQLRAGAARLDGRARAQHSVPFASLPPADQDVLLEEASAADRAFFIALKAQTIDAYYKSEMGQVGELEWVGHEFNDDFPGACAHGDPMVHPRPTWPRSRE